MRYSYILATLLVLSFGGCSGDTNEKVDITAISEPCAETIPTPATSWIILKFLVVAMMPFIEPQLAGRK